MKMTVTFEFDSMSEAREFAPVLLSLDRKKTNDGNTDDVKAVPMTTVIVNPPPPVETAEAPATTLPTGNIWKETVISLWGDIENHLGERAKGLGRRQKEVVAYLYEQPENESKTREVAVALGIKSSAASNILSTLHSERGLTESIKRGVWRLVAEASPAEPDAEDNQPETQPAEEPSPESKTAKLSLDDLDI